MSDSGRLLSRSAVFVMVYDAAGRIMLLRRHNTGYMDGRYDIPAGHVERGELLLDAAVRELAEETDVRVKSEDLKLVHINQFSANDIEYYNFFFRAEKWSGTPKIVESGKCDDISFFDLGKLPKMTAGTHVALNTPMDKDVTFGIMINQEVYDSIAGE